jgi:hypothetical protein
VRAECGLARTDHGTEGLRLNVWPPFDRVCCSIPRFTSSAFWLPVKFWVPIWTPT